MQKLKLVGLLTILGAILLFNILTLFTNLTPKVYSCNNSKWAEVCCGPTCGGQDYCLGNGPYSCCK